MKELKCSVGVPVTKDNWIKAYSKIMLEWIESQWKIESAHQAGEPYTRMKFEADASKVEDKLKNLISQVEKDAKSESYTNGFRGGFDAGVEKTNKGIVLGLEELANTKLGKSVYQDGIRQGIRESQKYISDLLEDKHEAM